MIALAHQLPRPLPSPPRDVATNCRYRKSLIRWSCGPDKKRRQDHLWHLCRRDVLFWINTFLFTYAPKLYKRCPVRPFVTWPFQDEAILAIENAIVTGEDLCIVKSRDMGATWMVAAVKLHRWLFFSRENYLVVSRNEDYVDKPGDEKAIYAKFDFMLEYLPGWMKPQHTRTALHLRNNENKTSIEGESTTGDVARGGRPNAILLDEFAAVQPHDAFRVIGSTAGATDCRIFNSTYQGMGNAFYEISMNPEIKKIVLHWTRHPLKNKNLTYDAKGRPTNAWYRKECARLGFSAVLIGQELDCDAIGSEYRFFPPELVDELLRETAIEPVCVGDIDFDAATLEPTGFDIRKKGPWSLWRHPHAITNNEALVCVIGSDVGTGGAKSSNSTLIVADALTGENIAEFANCTLRPEEFARVAIVASRFFGNALLIPERNGPGRIMVDAMLALGFRNIWFERSEITIGTPEGTKPGWFSTPDTKHGLLGDWRRALADRAYVCRSAMALKESLLYTYNPAGRVWSVLALNEQDPSGAGDNHGDRVIGHALAWKGCTTMRDTARETDRQVNPVVQDTNTFAFRRRMREHTAGRQGW